MWAVKGAHTNGLVARGRTKEGKGPRSPVRVRITGAAASYPLLASLVNAKLAKGLKVEEQWDVYLTAEVDQWLHDLKELRPGSTGRSEVRVLFMFDPWRSAILLTAGDKAGDWGAWYERAIPLAERAYTEYLADREKESGK